VPSGETRTAIARRAGSGWIRQEAVVLILTRKAEQGIVIDQVTTVRILSIDGDRVKIGIDAPTSITVLREELLEQVAGQNREAARPGGNPRAVQQLKSLGRNGASRSNGGSTERADSNGVAPEPEHR